MKNAATGAIDNTARSGIIEIQRERLVRMNAAGNLLIATARRPSQRSLGETALRILLGAAIAIVASEALTWALLDERLLIVMGLG